MADKPEEYLTVHEAAERLKVTRDTVYEWLWSGKLKGIKVSASMWRIRESEIHDFMRRAEEGK